MLSAISTVTATFVAVLPNVAASIFAKIATEAFAQKVLERIVIKLLMIIKDFSTNDLVDETAQDMIDAVRAKN